VAGDLDGAWTRGQEALDYARRFMERGQEAWTLHLLGDIASRRGVSPPDEPEGLYRAAMVIAEPLEMRPAIAHCHLGLGELYARTARREPAREHLRIAAAAFRAMGIASFQERAEQRLVATGE
jgi:hypothetical protein